MMGGKTHKAQAQMLQVYGLLISLPVSRSG